MFDFIPTVQDSPELVEALIVWHSSRNVADVPFAVQGCGISRVRNIAD
jgi:hypothetical protein